MSENRRARSDRSKAFTDPQGRTLPERIRQRRQDRRLQSNELARALGVSPAYVTMIERGKKVPSEEVAVAIAERLGDDPELYRAWVHSTRFTDPETTLRGFQRLFYSPPASMRNLPGRVRAASERARNKRDLSLSGPSPAAPGVPLIVLGRGDGRRVTFWRLPWLLLEDDPRSVRYLVATTPDPDRLLVATPSEFARVFLAEARSDARMTAEWLGWRDVGRTDSQGGSYSPDYDRETFADLLRERDAFLASLEPEVDVVLFDEGRVSVERMTPGELDEQLSRPSRG